MDPTFLDEIDCESFFYHVDDLIDFPSENEYGGLNTGDFPPIWDDTLSLDDPIFPFYNGNCVSELSTELPVPHEDILQLEWLSTFMEDSFADGGMTITNDNNSFKKEPSQHQFQASSPISVLESSSSSSCSEGKTLPLSASHQGPQRARSKRPRPTTFSPRPPIQLISTSSLFGEKHKPFVGEKHKPFVAPRVSSESEYFAECHPADKTSNSDSAGQKKTKKLKLTSTSSTSEVNQNPPAQAVRKCMHCEITKTPQWRVGPMGPKTLCNACGVRYKSGRLFPEYRPAASPTFVPSVHSNSHKRVIEMRNKSVQTGCTALSVTSEPTTSQPQLE
ncbi:zinc finger transcription factor [Lithospermum erythrorhizon]|uniref:GATA transcription factor n=1 Tax=Lithospermum erythrorhizon TaxID=34254 RepID=A0AAV3RWX3_LITER